MATKGPGHPAFGKIEHECGRQAYEFAELFLKYSGLTRIMQLNTLAEACIDDQSPMVCFKRSHSPYPNGIAFVVEDGIVEIEYSIPIAASDEDLISKADLVSTIQRIVQNKDSSYKFKIFSCNGNPARGISLHAKVHIQDFMPFAGLVGHIDTIISSYLKL